jgi:hypothetical protein
MRQAPVIVKGHIRDKLELIKIAAAKVQTEFRVDCNVDIIKAGDYDAELDGHVCVGEFDCTKVPTVGGRRHE